MVDEIATDNGFTYVIMSEENYEQAMAMPNLMEKFWKFTISVDYTGADDRKRNAAALLDTILTTEPNSINI